MEKFRKTPTFTCAVVQQCVLAIVEGKEAKSNERFLENIAEYILENIWQDSRRQFSPDNLTLVCFQTLSADEMPLEQLKILAKCFLTGLGQRLGNKLLVKQLLDSLDLNQLSDFGWSGTAQCSDPNEINAQKACEFVD